MNIPNQIEEFVCPISKQIFKEPVVASDGFFYEKHCILEWLKTKNLSPMTNLVISKNVHSCIFFNNLLKTFLENNPEEVRNQFAPSFDHVDNIDILNEIIKERRYVSLLKYRSFIMSKFQNYKIIKDLAKSNQHQVIMHLVDNVIDLNEKIHGRRLVHDLCQYSTPEMIKYIIDKGVDLECQDDTQSRPIHFICQYSTPEMIKYIIDKGVDLECLDNEQWKPIHLICRYSTPEMIKYIIDEGVDLECQNSYQWKPIHLICRNSTPKMIKYIIDKGVDLECQNDEQWKPIHLICRYSIPEMIKYIIDKGVDLECQVNEWKPIHYICRYSTPEMIKYIMASYPRDKICNIIDRIVYLIKRNKNVEDKQAFINFIKTTLELVS